MPTQFEIDGAIAVQESMAALLDVPAESRLGPKLLPLARVRRTTLIYERRDVVRGLQHGRGRNGPPGPISIPGFGQRAIAPGKYGDFYNIIEERLENTRRVADWFSFQNGGEITRDVQQAQMKRLWDRVEYNIFRCLTDGLVEVADAGGSNVQTRVYDITQFRPIVPFSDLAAASPLNFFRDIVPQIQRGRSVNFRRQKGTMYMNSFTFNLLIKNTNPADLGQRRIGGGNTVNNEGDYSTLLAEDNLPGIVVYDGGFYPAAAGPFPAQADFQYFIPFGKILLVGSRDDGEPIGQYALTRAAQNGEDAPGDIYVNVKDMRADIPAQVVVTCGHNGGPELPYSEAVATLIVAA